MEKYIAIDADSIDTSLRKIILSASQRTGLKSLFVADRMLGDVIGARNRGINVAMLVLDSAQDAADNYIVDHSDEVFFCISHDVPLAARLAERGISTLDKRGNIIDDTNYRQHLSIRDNSLALREEGVFLTKSSRRKLKDNEYFANSLQLLINRVIASENSVL